MHRTPWPGPRCLPKFRPQWLRFCLPGVPIDVQAMTKLLRDDFGMHVEEHLVGHGPQWEKMDKRKIVGILNKLFNDGSTSTLLVYVAGHGDGDEDDRAPRLGDSGNWIIDNYGDPKDRHFKTISLREILILWLAARKKRTDSPKLVICMDVCFGGTVSSALPPAPPPAPAPWPGAKAKVGRVHSAHTAHALIFGGDAVI